MDRLNSIYFYKIRINVNIVEVFKKINKSIITSQMLQLITVLRKLVTSIDLHIVVTCL